MVRQLTVLQPGLAAAGAAGGAFRPEAVRAFERARTYYTLLTYSADSLVKVAADRPGRFTPSEYLALLQVGAGSRLQGLAALLVSCWRRLLTSCPCTVGLSAGWLVDGGVEARDPARCCVLRPQSNVVTATRCLRSP